MRRGSRRCSWNWISMASLFSFSLVLTVVAGDGRLTPKELLRFFEEFSPVSSFNLRSIESLMRRHKIVSKDILPTREPGEELFWTFEEFRSCFLRALQVFKEIDTDGNGLVNLFLFCFFFLNNFKVY